MEWQHLARTVVGRGGESLAQVKSVVEAAPTSRDDLHAVQGHGVMVVVKASDPQRSIGTWHARARAPAETDWGNVRSLLEEAHTGGGDRKLRADGAGNLGCGVTYQARPLPPRESPEGGHPAENALSPVDSNVALLPTPHLARSVGAAPPAPSLTKPPPISCRPQAATGRHRSSGRRTFRAVSFCRASTGSSSPSSWPSFGPARGSSRTNTIWGTGRRRRGSVSAGAPCTTGLFPRRPFHRQVATEEQDIR